MGILERIEAQQLEILSLLKKTPVADAVGKSTSVDTAPTTPMETAPTVEATPAPSVEDTVNVELDSEGLPWDARIHASTKTKTVKNVWKSVKGAKKLPDDQVAAIKAELLASVSAAPAPTAAPAPQAAPAPTAAPAPQAAPAPTNDFKAKAIVEFNRLDKEFNVDYDTITEILEQFNGAKTFNELQPESYEAAFKAMQAWANSLTQANAEIQSLNEMLTEAGAAPQIATIIQNWGVDNIAGIHYAEIDSAVEKLKEYRIQIQEWKATQV